jgi:uncharacterized protein (TIRG00374 family)
MSAESRRWLALGLGILVLGGLLVRSFYRNPEWRSFEWAAFGRSLLSVDPVWAAWALLAIYITYLVRALRWRALMAPMKPRASLWSLFSATVIGFAAIGVLGRAGEMVRPYLVARKEAVPLSSQLAVWVVERSFDTLAVLATVAFALREFHGAGLESRPLLAEILRKGASVVAFSTVALIILLFALRNFAEPITRGVIRRLDGLSPRLLRPDRRTALEHSLQAFVEGTRGVRELRVLSVCTAYTAVEWLLIAFCYAAVFNSLGGGLRLSVSETLIFMGAVMVGSMVNLPGVAGGIQVASLLVLTEWFGLRPEPAASISLLIWVFTFLAVIPPALLLMLHEGLSWGKLRRLESEN